MNIQLGPGEPTPVAGPFWLWPREWCICLLRVRRVLLTLDQQPAFPGQHEERLLLRLGMVEAAWLAWLQAEPRSRDRLVFVRPRFGQDTSEALADQIVRLDVVDALFVESALSRSHLLPLSLALDGRSPCAPNAPIPEVAERWSSLAPPATERTAACASSRESPTTGCSDKKLTAAAPPP